MKLHNWIHVLLYFGNLTENKFPDVMSILRYAYTVI